MNEDRTPNDPVVLFVCQHGSAKSVVAAAHLERLARLRGLRLRALARGIDPDPQVSAPAAAGLAGDGLNVTGYRPQRLIARDLRGVVRVVSFGCDLSAVVPSGLVLERWDDTPAVADGYLAARDSIVGRIERLLQNLHAVGHQTSPADGGAGPQGTERNR